MCLRHPCRERTFRDHLGRTASGRTVTVGPRPAYELLRRGVLFREKVGYGPPERADAPGPESQIQRAAAAPVSSGRVLKAMDVCGAARRMALITASNRVSRLGGRRTPAPITTQS